MIPADRNPPPGHCHLVRPARSVTPTAADRCVMTTANWRSAAASRPGLRARSTTLFLLLVSLLLATVPALGLLLSAVAGPETRGTALNPGRRVFLCQGQGAAGPWAGAAVCEPASTPVAPGPGGDGTMSPPCQAD